MRNKVIAMLLLAAIMPTAQSQYSDLYYHRVGDTIEWRSDIGYYAWWEFETYYEHNLRFAFCGGDATWYRGRSNVTPEFRDSAIAVQRYYTPTPLKVVGLAGCCFRGTNPSGLNYDLYMDTNEYKEYFVIYDARPDSFPLIGKLEWNPYDPHRTLHIPYHNGVVGPGPDSCCHGFPDHFWLPLYEYYFDSAITVSDSFYVGGTFFGEEYQGIRTAYAGAKTLGDAYDSCMDNEIHEIIRYIPSGNKVLCLAYPCLYKVKHDDNFPWNPPAFFSDAEWEWWQNYMIHMMVYPIVQMDTTVPPADACLPMSNVQVTTSGTTATVTWDDFPNYSRVLLRYGMCNQPVIQWTEEDVTGSTLHTLTGLTETACYGVSLKAECDTCRKETPWSEPKYFYTSHGTEGMEGEATALSRLTYVQPNPAREEVRVTSSFSLRRIELHDLSGVMVYSEPVFGHEKELDVSWLRAGTYIMTIATHDGTTHKRLQIVR